MRRNCPNSPKKHHDICKRSMTSGPTLVPSNFDGPSIAEKTPMTTHTITPVQPIARTPQPDTTIDFDLAGEFCWIHDRPREYVTDHRRTRFARAAGIGSSIAGLAALAICNAPILVGALGITGVGWISGVATLYTPALVAGTVLLGMGFHYLHALRRSRMAGVCRARKALRLGAAVLAAVAIIEYAVVPALT
jgi:hypothetical protein